MEKPRIRMEVTPEGVCSFTKTALVKSVRYIETAPGVTLKDSVEGCVKYLQSLRMRVVVGDVVTEVGSSVAVVPKHMVDYEFNGATYTLEIANYIKKILQEAKLIEIEDIDAFV